MSNVELHELGARVMRALRLENEGKVRWRAMEISMRWYDQFSLSRSVAAPGQSTPNETSTP